MSNTPAGPGTSPLPVPGSNLQPCPTDDALGEFASLELRERLRADLLAARKARQPDTMSAIRTTLAALDNAAAVPVPDETRGAVASPIAGARLGVGSTEVARRNLSFAESWSILAAEVTERLTAADDYDAHGQHDAASRLRREAQALGIYLPAPEPASPGS